MDPWVVQRRTGSIGRLRSRRRAVGCKPEDLELGAVIRRADIAVERGHAVRVQPARKASSVGKSPSGIEADVEQLVLVLARARQRGHLLDLLRRRDPSGRSSRRRGGRPPRGRRRFVISPDSPRPALKMRPPIAPAEDEHADDDPAKREPLPERFLRDRRRDSLGARGGRRDRCELVRRQCRRRGRRPARDGRRRGLRCGRIGARVGGRRSLGRVGCLGVGRWRDRRLGTGRGPATERSGRTVPQLAHPTAHGSFSAEQRVQVHRSVMRAQ